ncbi:MAG TPA: hypothetical protein EYM89_04415, partial [Candidatus Marinimicrobia bacterium]|nr:hypothetical protein [Candidatus Neomarinimicrobiota bacterium]
MKKTVSVLFMTLVFAVNLSAQSAKDFSDTFADVVKKVNSAVVTITSERVVTDQWRHPFEEFFAKLVGMAKPIPTLLRMRPPVA